jgi:hypothetical protein
VPTDKLPDALGRYQQLLVTLVAIIAISPVVSFFFVRRIIRKYKIVAYQFRDCLESHLVFLADVAATSKDPTIRKGARPLHVSRRARDYTIVLCCRMAEIFSLLTNCECHASIKSFDNGTSRIETRTRDTLMHNAGRGEADERSASYYYANNTAFCEIIDKHKFIFFSNHLLMRAMFRRYLNSNPHWRRHYSATVVIPILVSGHASDVNAESILGFVCIDNKGGGFRRRSARASLSLFVVLIRDVMILVGQSVNVTPPGGDHA